MIAISDTRTEVSAPDTTTGFADELGRTVYNELHKLARARIRRLRPGESLQPTELVHEAYIGLYKNQEGSWENRAHFFGAAARAMRDVMVAHARARSARKRGGDQVRVDITMTLPERDKPLMGEEILALHDALEQMSTEYPEHAELVLLNYFAGLTKKRIAELHGVTTRTIERRWRFARAWLHARITRR